MGTSAQSQLVMNPRSTLWGFKPLLGKSFSDPFVQTEMQRLPFEIVCHGSDDVGIKVSTVFTYLKGIQLFASVLFFCDICDWKEKRKLSNSI